LTDTYRGFGKHRVTHKGYISVQRRLYKIQPAFFLTFLVNEQLEKGLKMPSFREKYIYNLSKHPPPPFTPY